MENTGVLKLKRKLMGKNPAQFQYSTKTLFINPDVWKHYSKCQRTVALLHEVGHAQGHRSELEADQFAVNEAVRSTEYSRTQATNALISLLDKRNPSHLKRINHLKNKNTMYHNEEYASDFFGKYRLGITKKGRNLKEQAKQKHADRKIAKINARGANKVANTQAGGGWQNAAKGAGNFAKGALNTLLGKGETEADGGDYPPAEEDSNTTLFIGIGVALVVAVVVFVVLKKKK